MNTKKALLFTVAFALLLVIAGFVFVSEAIIAGIWGEPGSLRREQMDCIDDIGHWDEATNSCIPDSSN